MHSLVGGCASGTFAPDIHCVEPGGVAEGRRAGRGVAPAALALLMLVATSMLVSAVEAKATTPAINYPDFSNIAGLTLNGDAAQSGKALRLTPATSQRRGSAWAQAQLDTTQSFESRFQAFTHDGSIYPADGMTFTLQSEGVSALGDAGSDHGHGGAVPVSPSVAVDISLFPQIFNGGTEQINVLANGDTLKPLATATSGVLLYGSPFSVWVDYDANTHALQVFVSQAATKPTTPLLSTPVDLTAIVGASAYAGFTAGTGVLDTNFDLLNWQVDAVGDVTPPTVTCAAVPNVLWPPNNKLVPVTTAVAVTDSGSGSAGFTLLSVTSNEGDIGSESKDWTLGTPDTSGLLQASRLGTGKGRIYTLTYKGIDKAGNTASCSTTVSVPHDQGKS